MMLEDLLSQACLALGTAICGPCSACALLATVLSHLLGGGRGRKSAPWSWLLEEMAGKEAVGTDHQVLGDSPLPLWGMLIHAFLGS